MKEDGKVVMEPSPIFVDDPADMSEETKAVLSQ